MTSVVKLTEAERDLLDLLPEGPARSRLGERGLPHRRVEEWKWSDLKAAAAKAVPSRGAADALETDGFCVIDIAAAASGEAVNLPAGVTLSLEASAPDPEERHAVADLAGALAASVVRLEVAEPVEQPIVVVFDTDAAISGARLDVRLSPGASLTLVEHHLGAGFAARLTTFEVGEGSVLERLVLEDEGASAVSAKLARGTLSKAGRYGECGLAFGAKLARREIHLEHAGEGAEARIDGAYLLANGRHADATSIVAHRGPNGVTSQLSKGAAATGAKGVFQGKIHVDRIAQKTDAQMQHRGLLLDENAEIDAKPELMIYADDVACAHGNALGAIDETALFYMRQRGLPETRARALLTESFLAEPLQRIAHEGLREQFTALLRKRLEEVA